MNDHPHIDRDAIRNLSNEEIHRLVEQLRVRSELIDEELRVLQEQIRESSASIERRRRSTP